jgi:translocation and assembly module TamA
VVAFVEAASVTESNRISFKKKSCFVGYGVGTRYYTAIGPIRLDLGFPTRKRTVNKKRYDSPIQFYISIGQAF